MNVEIWLYGIVAGQEFGRVYITSVSEEESEHAIDIYIRNGCARQTYFKEALPFAQLEYRLKKVEGA